MVGGGVVADTCLALNLKCWCFDMDSPYILRGLWVRLIRRQQYFLDIVSQLSYIFHANGGEQ